MADKQVAVRLVVQGGQRVKDDLKQVGQAGDQALGRLSAGSQRAGSSVRRANAEITQMGSASRQTAHQLQNASYQVGDFFVQIASGTGAMRAAAMQLPQLLGGFGLVGAGLGMLAAIGGAVVPMFLETEDGAKAFDDRMQNLDQTMRSYKEAVEFTNKPMVELLDQFGKNAVAAREVAETLALIERIKLGNQVQDLRDGIDGAARDIDYLLDKAAAATATGVGGPQVGIDVQERLRREYGLTIEQAQLVKAALDDLETARGPTEVAQAAQRLAEALMVAGRSGEQIPRAMLESANEAARLANAGYEAAAVLGETEGAAGAAAGGLGTAASETQSWKAQMAGVHAEIVAIASALASMGGGLISNAAKYVELTALKQGKSIAEAARARREAEINAEYATKEMNAGTWVERMLVRGGRAVEMQGLQVDADLEAARASAREEARVKAKAARGGGRKKTDKDKFADAYGKTADQIAALKLEAAAYLEAAAAGTSYGDATDYARVKAQLLSAAQQEGMKVTPELTAKIEEQAQAYALAAQELEQAREKTEALQEASERGKDALQDVFGAVVEGGDAARRAVANLLLEMAKVQFMKAAFAMPGMGSLAAGIGSLLLPSADGGGYTGNSPRSGGLDGKGGFLAMLHPRETVIDHTKGGRVGGQMDVNVGVTVDGEGNLKAYVKDVARQEATSATTQGLAAYDRRLPDRMAQVNRKPRHR